MQAMKQAPGTAAPKPDKLPFTDVGNAQRLIRQHGQNLRYCKEWGKWLVWDEIRWVVDSSFEVERLAKGTIRDLYHMVATIKDNNKRQELLRHVISSESAPRIKSMIEMAKSEPGVSVMPDQLDADHYVLNVLNGTLDLRTGELFPHRRERLITKLAPVEYDPQAACPTWRDFLQRISAENDELIGFLQKAVGYSLTGSIEEQCFFIPYGSGQNGKSTFVTTVGTILGDYARHTPSETLLINHSESVRNDVARLQGARFVSAVEAEGGRKLAEALVKQLTGGDKVTARYLYQEHFEFKPTFKIWLAVNHKPIIQGMDHGIWRRIHLIPFIVTIPKEDQDKRLGEKLQAELSGILRWAVEGCLIWQQKGLEPPMAVKQATEDYHAEMDVITEFLQERCVKGPHKRVSKADLHADYAGWCALKAVPALTQKAFGSALIERGVLEGRSSGVRFWLGITLREDTEGQVGDT
jgi:putative DNA primase/helicase